MGNPNVGKSVVFSRLTGANVIASNYPGTTVDFSKGRLRLENETVEIIDAPGTYSLEPQNRAEEVATKMLEEADVIINVIDATNLERNLYLTLELIEQHIPMVIVLNLWDEAKHVGITIDDKKLQQLLKIPVIPTVALTGEGIKQLVNSLHKATINENIKPTSHEGRWIEIGSLVQKVEKVEHKHHTFRDRLADITINPVTGIPFSILIILSSFWIVRQIGETIITYFFDPLFEQYYRPLITLLSQLIGDNIWHTIFIGQYGEEVIFEQSLGMLTTGLYVPFAMVLPYIIAFYFMLSLLEDTGYMPRLATLVDNIFHKLGMHGHGIISVFLGLGCNVPGAMSTRTLETRKQRFISATLLSIAVPCMAQTAMVFGVLGRFGFLYIALVFFILGVLYMSLGMIMNHYVKGTSPEIFLEVPPYRRPSIRALFKKTYMRIRWFLKEAIPFLFFGVLLINIFYHIGVMQVISSALTPFMTTLFGLPGETTTSLVIGFLRKDLAVGTLIPLQLTALQFVIAVTMLTIYFPCVATFSVLLRELGLKDLVKSTLIMITTALSMGIILRLVFFGIP